VSEETVKAYKELAEIEEKIESVSMNIVTAEVVARTSREGLKTLKAQKRELLKVVKVVRTRAPKTKKPGRPKGSKNKGKTTIPAPASHPAPSGADSTARNEDSTPYIVGESGVGSDPVGDALSAQVARTMDALDRRE
jgi:hypothetical protein